MAKKRKRYSTYYWIDKKTGLGYARIQIPTEEVFANGKPKYKTIKKRANNQTHAEQLGQELLAEHQQRGPAFVEGREMTFQKLADWYKDEYLIEPRYVNGKKIVGMRTWQAERNKLDRLCERFGKMLLEEVDETILRRFKLKRFDEGVAVATVNRDFEVIRAMFRRAVKRKWLKDLPDFSELIDKSLESARTVTITSSQEERILAEARAMKNSPRLCALILTLLDSGARPSEVYPVNVT